MYANHLAIASTTVRATPDQVWRALTDPDLIREYMFGTEVSTDWKVGSHITYRGTWEGKKYQDEGMILDARPGELLRSTHFSALSGRQDIPENYHTVTYRLEAKGEETVVTLIQDNNDTEEAAQHSEKTWNRMLDGLKEVVERRG